METVSEANVVDVLAFPLLAQGHIIPFMRLCDLLSSKNLNVVFLTSPLNAERLRSTRAANNKNPNPFYPPVRVMDIQLPPTPGLPAGAETTDHMTPPQAKILLRAIEQTEASFREIIGRVKPKCILADFSPLFLPAMAAELKIPVFYYATTGAYGLSLMHAVVKSLPVPAADRSLALPDLPKPVALHDPDILPPYRGAGRTEFPHGFLSTVFDRLGRCIAGLVLNTFYELEAEFVDHIKSAFAVPVYPVMFLGGGGGGEGLRSESGVEEWLDRRAAGSVVYVSFGSEIVLSVEQMWEVAAGLEASGWCFVWTVKKPPPAGEVYEDGVDFFLPPGFKERTRDRGLIIMDWAPQQTILSHPSTGGFLSHCGWNSTLESVSQGVPILAWPFQHDQPFVKKLLVEELGVAEEVKRETENGAFVVKSTEIERAVKLLMEGEKGKEMRRKAKELKEAFLRAVGEVGSSCANLEKLAVVMGSIQIK